MLFSPRISTTQLTRLCRRVGMALEAGVDLRTAWAREAERAHGTMRQHFQAISHDINQGEAFATAIANSGDYFPELVSNMVDVGEQTGTLDAVLTQLAHHYEEQLNLRRVFLGAISWPAFQLALALLMIGIVIWVTGLIRQMPGLQNFDMLGLGLYGDSGLIIYLSYLTGIFAVVWFIVHAIRRGVVWTRPIQYFVMRVPVIGGALRTLALSRLTWSLHLTMDAGMELRRALRLSLRSTQNACLIDHIPVLDAEVLHGNTLYEAFQRAGGYPNEFLDAVAVAEQSGKLVETFAILSRQFHERARAAIVVLTTAAGWLVWMVIAAIIIMMVFRVFSNYLNVLNNATHGKFEL